MEGNVRGRRIKTLHTSQHQRSPSIKNPVSMIPLQCLTSICYPATTAKVFTCSCRPRSLKTLQNLQQPLLFINPWTRHFWHKITTPLYFTWIAAIHTSSFSFAEAHIPSPQEKLFTRREGKKRKPFFFFPSPFSPHPFAEANSANIGIDPITHESSKEGTKLKHTQRWNKLVFVALKNKNSGITLPLSILCILNPTKFLEPSTSLLTKWFNFS